MPVPGRDIKVQAWYQGGVSVFDFTDSANPIEIAYFDRGPMSDQELMTAGYWSTYWYNGYIYGSEIARGFDVLKLEPSEHLSRNELEAALLVRMDEFNPQHQPRMEWPASFPVARAYLDQLVRAQAIHPERAASVARDLERAEGAGTGQDLDSALDQLRYTASELDADASAPAAVDPDRMRTLAETIRELADSLG